MRWRRRPGQRAFQRPHGALRGAAWTWGGGAVRPVDDREGPVPVLLELLVAVVVHLAGLHHANVNRLVAVGQEDVRLWFWSEVAVRLDLQLRVELPNRRRYRHGRSCRAPRSWSMPSSGSSYRGPGPGPCGIRGRSPSSAPGRTRASPSPHAPVCRRPRIGRQCVAALSGSWCARRRLRCVSPAGRPPRTGPQVCAPVLT